jgi:NAD(P)-dependent dehydrogenase (short-subunit alcohol dehydrogenase family)
LSNLKDKVTLINGGASGIGRAAALKFGRDGAKVAIADRDAAGAKAACEEIIKAGGTAFAQEFDAGDSAAADAVVAKVVQTYGRLDVLIHCPGIVAVSKVSDMTDEQWRRVLSVNLDGTFYACRAAVRVMEPNKSGKIVVLASDRGIEGHPNNSAYAASKGGVIAFFRSLAREVGPSGITVNALNPGQTDTPLMRGTMSAENIARRAASDPLGRIGTPEDAAEMLYFLATTGGDIMTGQLVQVRMPGGSGSTAGGAR